MIIKYLFAFTILMFSVKGFSQESNWKRFGDLSFPEKKWVTLHPFIAKKALAISEKANAITDSLRKATLLPNEWQDGPTDAFRHIFWMATLSREIGGKKARQLGIAHEKGNKREFKKGQIAVEYLSDKASMEMDLYNNETGIAMDRSHQEASEAQMIQLALEAVKKGKAKIIRKDNKGNCLDKDGNIIPPEEWQGRWENKRVLTPSDL